MMPLWLAVALLAAGPVRSQPNDSRSVTLGPENQGQGLRVPNEGDGTNEPVEVAGRTGRRATATNPYLYVDVDDQWLPPGDHDLWVTVEFCPQSLATLSLQYDVAGPENTIATRYTPAPDSVLGYQVDRWMHFTFHLPHARLANGENYHSDFRFAPGGDLAFGKIEVSTTRPADYERTRTPRPEDLEPFRVHRAPGTELTFGGDVTPTTGALYSMLGVTSIESYAHWQSVEPDAEGTWDWRQWDPTAQVLRDSHLKWVPFLIAGPAYTTPDWFRKSPRSHACRCLEHHQESYVQSIWNPELLPAVGHYLAAFAQHYPPELIESVLLGVSGIYGESIYPAGPESGWTADRTGTYHNHAGFWCDDDLAQADFRRFLRARCGTIAQLNTRWGTRYASFDVVKPFLPKDSPGDRAYLDFRDWYMGAMTDWSERWVKAARERFPKSEIYLCTGGDGSVVLGADFSAQTKRLPAYRAGVRITNEGSSYADNFAITRWVASAGRLYGTYYGYEPAGGVDANGVVARIYNATASGCRQLHYYSDNVTGSRLAMERFRANAAFLRPRRPQVDVAVLLPSDWLALHQDAYGRFFSQVARLRDLVDLDFADANMIANGCLKRARFLVAPLGRQFEAKTLQAIEAWVREGGVLIATGDCRLATIEGDDRAQAALFQSPDADLLKRAAKVAIAEGTPGPSFCLQVGAPWDEPYLGGRWNGRENAGEWPEATGATKRWSGPQALAYLPVRARGAATLRVEAIVPGYAVGDNPVYVNGVQVGALNESAKRAWEFPVPEEALRRAEVAVVELNCRGWKPSDHGSGDTRELGIAVRSITLTAAGAVPAREGEAPPVKLESRFDGAAALPGCAKLIGKGATVYLPGSWDADQTVLLSALASALEHPEAYAPRAPSIIALDGRSDGVYWTLCEDSALVLNFTDAEVTRSFTVRPNDLRPAAARVGHEYRVTVPKRAIAEVPW